MAEIDTSTAVRFTADPTGGPCPHFTGLSPVTPSANGCQDCLQTAVQLGAPAAVPGVRARRVPRLLAEPARLRACRRHLTPGDHLP